MRRLLTCSGFWLLALLLPACSNDDVVASARPERASEERADSGSSAGGSGAETTSSSGGAAGNGENASTGGADPSTGGTSSGGSSVGVGGAGGGTSTDPRCDDGQKNGAEQGVDCGGPCAPCACAEGLASCSGVCVDLDQDEDHCGSCDKRCANGAESCVSGQCVSCRGLVAPTSYLDTRGSNEATGGRIADFDEDSRSDLLFTTSTTGTLHVKLGDGQGGFYLEKDLGLAPGGSAEVADLNADGHQDIVFITADQKVVAALGDGKGAFTAQDAMLAGVAPSAIAVADLNHDQRLDLAVANAGSVDVSLLFAKQDGGFGPEVRASLYAHDYEHDSLVPSQLAVAPTSIAAGDVNRDGNVDLLLGSDQGLQPLFGEGTATFTTYWGSLTEISGMGSFALADLDHDGKTDIVVSIDLVTSVGAHDGNSGEQGRIEVALDFDGLFAAGMTYYLAGDGTDVKVADVDHDGNLDIGAMNVGSGTLDVLLGHGDGSFADRRSFGLSGVPYAPSGGSANLAFADLNGDTRLDLVTVGSGVQAILNTDGTLFGQRAYPTIDSPQNLALADVTGDGFLDALVTSGWGGNLVLHEGSPSGVFGPAVRITNYPGNVGIHPPPLALGDFDQNGSLDFALGSFDTRGSANGHVSVYQRNAESVFESQANMPWPGYLTALVTGDLNEDGRPDLISTEGYTHTLEVRLGKPSAQFDSGTSYGAGNYWPGDAFVADVNGDSHLDVVVLTIAADYSDTGNISVFLGRGDGTLELQQATSPLDDKPLRMTPGDLNRDGYLDLVVRYYDRFDVLLGDGQGHFTLLSSYPDNPGLSSLNYDSNPLVAIADFSGDGVADVAVTLSGGLRVDLPDSPRVAIWRGTGNGGLRAPDYYPVGGGVSAIEAADLNGDGLADLVVLCSYSNNVTVIMNQAVCR